MATITEAIDASATEITVTGLDAPNPNTLLRIENEVVAFRSLATAVAYPYPKRSGVWRITRGERGSTAASHADNTTISVLLTEHGVAAIDTGGGGGDSVVLSATVTLTDAQIKALPTTAIEVVAAPGAGKMNYLLSSIWSHDWTADYTNIAAGASMYVSSGNADVSVMLDNTLGINVTDLLANGADAIAFAGAKDRQADVDGVPYAVVATTATNYANQALTLVAANGVSGDFTGGNAANTLKVTVLYSVIDL